MEAQSLSPAKKFYSDMEVAKYLGVSLSTVLRLRRSGSIGFYRVGGRVMISEEHIRLFLAQNETKVTAA